MTEQSSNQPNTRFDQKKQTVEKQTNEARDINTGGGDYIEKVIIQPELSQPHSTPLRTIQFALSFRNLCLAFGIGFTIGGLIVLGVSLLGTWQFAGMVALLLGIGLTYLTIHSESNQAGDPGQQAKREQSAARENKWQEATIDALKRELFFFRAEIERLDKRSTNGITLTKQEHIAWLATQGDIAFIKSQIKQKGGTVRSSRYDLLQPPNPPFLARLLSWLRGSLSYLLSVLLIIGASLAGTAVARPVANLLDNLFDILPPPIPSPTPISIPTPTLSPVPTVLPLPTVTVAPTDEPPVIQTEVPTINPTLSVTPTSAVPVLLPTVTPTPAESPVETPTGIPTIELNPTPTATILATVESSSASLPPTETPTATPTPVEPTPTATPTVTATATAIPTVISGALSGRIAYSVLEGDRYEVVVRDLATNSIVYRVPQARQPDLKGGGYLLVNKEGGALMRVDLNRGDEHAITLRDEDARPHWAPADDRVIFESFEVDKNNTILKLQLNTELQPNPPHLRSPAGGTIAGRNALFLENERIAFNACGTWNDATRGTCGIWSVNLDGSGVSQLTDQPHDYPSDNLRSQVLFTADRERNWDVYITQSPLQIQRLTDDPARDGLATASPNGDLIAFVSDRGGSWAIWVMNADGSGERKLFDLEGSFGEGERDWTSEKISWGL